jgi:hypothetical protein
MQDDNQSILIHLEEVAAVVSVFSYKFMGTIVLFLMLSVYVG